MIAVAKYRWFVFESVHMRGFGGLFLNAMKIISDFLVSYLSGLVGPAKIILKATSMHDAGTSLSLSQFPGGPEASLEAVESSLAQQQYVEVSKFAGLYRRERKPDVGSIGMRATNGHFRRF